MTISLTKGAAASNFSGADLGAAAPSAFASAFIGSGHQPPGDLPFGHQSSPEHVRHLLFGTPAVVQATIKLLHKLGYAEPNDWSRLMPTGKPNEVMAVLAKRV
ncbi:MAG: hypothetical protein WBD47_02770 [Phormidesmis sp.]